MYDRWRSNWIWTVRSYKVWLISWCPPQSFEPALKGCFARRPQQPSGWCAIWKLSGWPLPPSRNRPPCFFGALHTNSATKTVDQLINMFPTLTKNNTYQNTWLNRCRELFLTIVAIQLSETLYSTGNLKSQHAANLIHAEGKRFNFLRLYKLDVKTECSWWIRPFQGIECQLKISLGNLVFCSMNKARIQPLN